MVDVGQRRESPETRRVKPLTEVRCTFKSVGQLQRHVEEYRDGVIDFATLTQLFVDFPYKPRRRPPPGDLALYKDTNDGGYDPSDVEDTWQEIPRFLDRGLLEPEEMLALVAATAGPSRSA